MLQHTGGMAMTPETRDKMWRRIGVDNNFTMVMGSRACKCKQVGFYNKVGRLLESIKPGKNMTRFMFSQYHLWYMGGKRRIRNTR